MRTLVPFLLLTACSEYDLGQPLPPEQPPSESGNEQAEEEEEAVEEEAVEEEEPGETEQERVPEDFGTVDCEDGVTATWLSGELAALSYDTDPSIGMLNSTLTGNFHVYDIVPAESGAAQWNESMYLRVTNTTESIGMPVRENCGGDFIVVDADNQGDLPAGTTQYLGTFWLEAGDNNVEVWHACPRMRDGECPDQHIEDEPSSTCDSTNINSVHLTGQAICLVPV
jgi:hypothetical protein